MYYTVQFNGGELGVTFVFFFPTCGYILYSKIGMNKTFRQECYKTTISTPISEPQNIPVFIMLFEK